MSRRIPAMSISAVLLMVAMLLSAVPASAQSPGDGVLYEVVTDATNEPMTMEIADDGRIIWGQRDGVIWVMGPDGSQTLAGKLNVSANASISPDPSSLTQRPNRLGAGGLEEGGLQGILLHRDFAENNTIFVYYSVPNTRTQVNDRFEGEFRLSTIVLDPTTNLLDLTTEEELLTVPAEWDFCCHYGGDLDYLPDGTIVLATGDDVLAEASSGYGPRDHRTFQSNAERTSANPADRRGKILRLREDGSVPDGSQLDITGEPEMPNPFIGLEGFNPNLVDGAHYGRDYDGEYDADGDGWIAYDPYVYSTGWKQAWRSVVHRDSGLMYTSEVGPDSSGADGDYSDPSALGEDYLTSFGPPGYEEVNATPFGGGTHTGWPYCTGPNFPYADVNWETGEHNGFLDCGDAAFKVRPAGSTDVDDVIAGPYTTPDYYYPSTACDPENDGCAWPSETIGTGGKTSQPVAYYYGDTDGALRLPAAYDDRLLLLEWSRRYLLTIPSDPATGALDMDPAGMWQVPITPGDNLSLDRPTGLSTSASDVLQSPIDGKVNPVDGAFYFIEYGATFYAGATGRLSRIRNAEATPTAGANYGLPVGTADELAALDAGRSAAQAGVLPVAPQTLVLLGLGAALVAIVRRRRTALV